MNARDNAPTQPPEPARQPTPAAAIAPAPRALSGSLDGSSLLALQQSAGNAAVTALVARAAIPGAAAVRPPRPSDGDATGARGPDAAVAVGLADAARARRESPPAEAGAVVAPELDSWKAALASATSAIAEPELESVSTAPDALTAHAAEVGQQRAAERPDFGTEARGQVPATPKGPPPADRLDTTAADAAVAAVDAAAGAKLSDQSFPAVAGVPIGFGTPASAIERSVAPGSLGDVRPDPNAHAVAGRLDGLRPAPPVLGPRAPVVLSGTGAASLDPLPPAQATHIGDVAARVLAQAPEFAKQIVDAATGTLDPGHTVAAFDVYGAQRLAEEEQALTGELQGIATAAGVSADELDAKVAAQQTAVKRIHGEAEAKLDGNAAAAKDDVAKRGEDELGRIGGAAAAVKDDADRKLEATRGTADPSVINGRRDTYLEKVTAAAAAGSARLRAAKERRIADLRRTAGEQKATSRAYNAASEAPGPRNPTPATDDFRTARAGERALVDVDGDLARLTRELGEEAEHHEHAIAQAAAAAREQIREWAAENLGHQRGWWERMMDTVGDWATQAKADTRAWEAQRDAETRDKVASDFTMLARLRDDMAAGNREAVLHEMSRLGREQRAVVTAFMQSGGSDAVGAVAAGMVERIKGHRVPELAKKLEEQAIKDLPWAELNKLGELQTPGFDAGRLVRDVRGAVKGWGTDEKRLFKALESHTPLQLAAMRKAYLEYYGLDMDEDVDDDLSGSEAKRAKGLLTGDPTLGAVATLRDAMDGAGTDEDLIMQTLRGRTPAERDAIVAAYEKQYGRKLHTDLDSEMGGHELGQAEALLEGDTVKADAMAIKDAMDGIGTGEAAINAVYARIRDEVETEADAKGMDTAKVEAEIKRRTAELNTVYGDTFARGDQGALAADYESELSGGELDYALAQQAGDRTAMDAAQLHIEHESAWTGDDKVNEILKAQYQRAEREIMRDLAIDFNARSAHMPRAQRAAAWKQVQASGRKLAEVRSRGYMSALERAYDKTGLMTSFDQLITEELTGYSRDEARERIASGGKLSDAKELKYAIFGLGTNEHTIKEVVKGKSKAELAELADQYRALTGNDLLDDLEGDLAGRDEADTLIKFRTGDSTVAERRAYLHERSSWELTKGTGVWGLLAEREEARMLIATNVEVDAAYEQYERVQGLPEDDPKRREAEAKLERYLGYGDKDIERHREQLDSVTETIATVGAIAAGIAVTILSGGTAAVGLLAAYFGTTTAVVAAGVGALAAAGVSMAIKENMKGSAYGGEEIATDVAQGTADAVVAVATFGVGEGAIKMLARAPAFAILARAAEAGTLRQLGVKGVESGVEGLIQGIPSGMMSAILNEETWRSPNPLAVILEAGGKAALQSAEMGAGMGVGMHAAQTRIRGRSGAPEHATPHAEPASTVPGEQPAPRRGRRFERHATVDSDLELDRVLDELDPAPTDEPGTAGSDREPAKQLAVAEMRDGTIIRGDPPLSPTQANVLYEKVISDAKFRNEAMIMKNVVTGERIVLKGHAKGVDASPEALAELLKDGGNLDDWVPVRHFHAVGSKGLTRNRHRVPSGIGGDMAGARRIALDEGHMHVEMLDIVTENGLETLYFGYDPEARQYFVGRRTKAGRVEYEHFDKLDEYHEWAERELGEPISVIADKERPVPDPLERNAENTPDDDDPDAPPPPPNPFTAVPPVKTQHTAEGLKKEFGTNPAELRARLMDRLSKITRGMDPTTLPPKYLHAVEVLSKLPGTNNARVAELLPIVMEGLRNPALYAEVMVEVYQLILADPDANPNFNTALMRLAENGGGGKLEVIPKEFGNFNPKFFPEHASKKVHMVDLPFQKTEHGALIHIVQDLVVNKALAERGMTSVEFRELLGKCEDWVTSDTFEPTTRDHPKAIRVGDMLWQETYDSTAEDASHMNTPEDVFPILRDMFGLH